MRRIHSFLGTSETLSTLLAQQARDEGLLRRVRARLPADLSDQCRRALLDDGCLTLITASPVWSTRLRFSLPQIIADLNADGTEVHRGDIRVVPTEMARSEAPKRIPTTLTPRACECLRQAAAAVSDPALAASLRRLAHRGSGDADSPAS